MGKVLEIREGFEDDEELAKLRWGEGLYVWVRVKVLELVAFMLA